MVWLLVPTLESESEVAQSCLTLCNPWTVACTRLLHLWDFPGKNTGVGCYFLLQGSSQPRDRTWVSRIAGRHFTFWAIWMCQLLILSKFCKKRKYAQHSCQTFWMLIWTFPPLTENVMDILRGNKEKETYMDSFTMISFQNDSKFSS